MSANGATRPVVYIGIHPQGGYSLRWPRKSGQLTVMTESDAAMRWPEHAMFTAADYDALRAEVERLREECAERKRIGIEQAKSVLEHVAYGTREYMRDEAAEAKFDKTKEALINANQEFDYLSNRRDLSAEDRGRFTALARLTNDALNEGGE